MGAVAHTGQHTNIIHTQIKLKNNEEIKFLKRKNEGEWSKRIYPMPFYMVSERAVPARKIKSLAFPPGEGWSSWAAGCSVLFSSI